MKLSLSIPTSPVAATTAAGRTARRHAAFSLIEIMVAVSILAFMIVGLLAMFYHVQRAFRSGVTQSDVMEGGRAFMSAITRELQEATPGGIEFGANVLIEPAEGLGAWGQLAATQDLPSGQPRQNFLQNLSFLTRNNGDWNAIGYRVLDGTTGLGTLYRTSLSTNYDSNPLIASNRVFRLSDVFFRPRPVDDTFHKILDGVVHFYITAYDTNGHYFTNAVIQNVGFGFTNQLMPAYLEIELGVLEPSAVAKFRANREVSPAAGDNYLRKQIGKTHLFRQRVAIRPTGNPVESAY